MTSIDIALVLISGLGVLHGLFLATFLWRFAKDNLSIKILCWLLLVLSFRIGKSVFLEFNENLDVKLIFTGLATLMAIGPLFYFYTLSSIDKDFHFKKAYILHFIPVFVGLCFGVWIEEPLLHSLPILFFLLMFACYYGHYLVYLMVSYSRITRAKSTDLNPKTFHLLRLLFYSLLAIWVAYVLNLFDEFIPYIVSPILYTLIAYWVSIVIISKGYIPLTNKKKYKTTPISTGQIKELFDKVNRIVVDDMAYRNPNLTLKTLSERLNVSTQILSLVINKESNSNFNSYINHHRIGESKKMLVDEDLKNHTIASIAFEAGFNSITSFNTAFKKQTGKTPFAFRNEVIK
ncbi:MAG: AraC family transcriptional regulator [Reichenbachiella sp.]